MSARRLLLLVVACVWLASDARAQLPDPENCEVSQLPSHALAKICVPPNWNQQLVVFAQGYVASISPTLVFLDRLPDGSSLAALVQSQGFAYATTSYRRNGLVILEGIDDIRELVTAFKSQHGEPIRSFLTGASEGGLVTTLLAERFPALFTGAYATCAPIGSFKSEVEYITDFRVLFDYYFPGLFGGTAVNVLLTDIQAWLGPDLQGIVSQRLLADRARALELMRVSRAAYDPSNFNTVVATTLGLLGYNILGSNDFKQKLGGSVYDNRLRWYFGSSNDLRLNLKVDRFAADVPALIAIRAYETSGNLRVPMVTLHTTADPIVPITQELQYLFKVRPSGRGRFIPLPVFRYGHCTFTTNEVLTGLGVLVVQP